MLVCVHELGHFAAAKACGVRVEEFALGMGPAILQKQKGETVYVCRLARRAVALGITTDAIRTQFHFIQNDWKTGDVTTS